MIDLAESLTKFPADLSQGSYKYKLFFALRNQSEKTQEKMQISSVCSKQQTKDETITDINDSACSLFLKAENAL